MRVLHVICVSGINFKRYGDGAFAAKERHERRGDAQNAACLQIYQGNGMVVSRKSRALLVGRALIPTIFVDITARLILLCCSVCLTLCWRSDCA